jgi:hypothetical protein
LAGRDKWCQFIFKVRYIGKMSRVERWRGRVGSGMSVYPAFACVAQNRMPCPVSTSRSSNRTCGFAASGSRTRIHAHAHERW